MQLKWQSCRPSSIKNVMAAVGEKTVKQLFQLKKMFFRRMVKTIGRMK